MASEEYEYQDPNAAEEVPEELRFDHENLLVEALAAGKSEDDVVPYTAQGDEAFYTAEALKQRRELIKHPAVQEKLDLFWATFRRGFGSLASAKPGSKAHEKYEAQKRAMESWTEAQRAAFDETVQFHEYVDVHLKMAKALHPHFEYDKAYVLAVQDWEHDTGSLDTGHGMSYEACKQSIFEVADIWTPGLSPGDYVGFLRKLFERITHPVMRKVGVEEVLEFVWKDLGTIECMIEDDSDEESESSSSEEEEEEEESEESEEERVSPEGPSGRRLVRANANRVSLVRRRKAPPKSPERKVIRPKGPNFAERPRPRFRQAAPPPKKPKRQIKKPSPSTRPSSSQTLQTPKLAANSRLLKRREDHSVRKVGESPSNQPRRIQAPFIEYDPDGNACFRVVRFLFERDLLDKRQCANLIAMVKNGGTDGHGMHLRGDLSMLIRTMTDAGADASASSQQNESLSPAALVRALQARADSAGPKSDHTLSPSPHGSMSRTLSHEAIEAVLHGAKDDFHRAVISPGQTPSATSASSFVKRGQTSGPQSPLFKPTRAQVLREQANRSRASTMRDSLGGDVMSPLIPTGRRPSAHFADAVEDLLSSPAAAQQRDLNANAMERMAAQQQRRPSVAGTRRPSVAGMRRPSVANARRPSVADARRPSVAGMRRPSVAGMRRPSVAGMRRPSVAGMWRPSMAGARRPSMASSRNPSMPSSRNPSAAQPAQSPELSVHSLHGSSEHSHGSPSLSLSGSPKRPSRTNSLRSKPSPASPAMSLSSITENSPEVPRGTLPITTASPGSPLFDLPSVAEHSPTSPSRSLSSVTESSPEMSRGTFSTTRASPGSSFSTLPVVAEHSPELPAGHTSVTTATSVDSSPNASPSTADLRRMSVELRRASVKARRRMLRQSQEFQLRHHHLEESSAPVLASLRNLLDLAFVGMEDDVPDDDVAQRHAERAWIKRRLSGRSRFSIGLATVDDTLPPQDEQEPPTPPQPNVEDSTETEPGADEIVTESSGTNIRVVTRRRGSRSSSSNNNDNNNGGSDSITHNSGDDNDNHDTPTETPLDSAANATSNNTPQSSARSTPAHPPSRPALPDEHIPLQRLPAIASTHTGPGPHPRLEQWLQYDVQRATTEQPFVPGAGTPAAPSASFQEVLEEMEDSLAVPLWEHALEESDAGWRYRTYGKFGFFPTKATRMGRSLTARFLERSAHVTGPERLSRLLPTGSEFSAAPVFGASEASLSSVTLEAPRSPLESEVSTPGVFSHVSEVANDTLPPPVQRPRARKQHPQRSLRVHRGERSRARHTQSAPVLSLKLEPGAPRRPLDPVPKRRFEAKYAGCMFPQSLTLRPLKQVPSIQPSRTVHRRHKARPSQRVGTIPAISSSSTLPTARSEPETLVGVSLMPHAQHTPARWDADDGLEGIALQPHHAFEDAVSELEDDADDDSQPRDHDSQPRDNDDVVPTEQHPAAKSASLQRRWSVDVPDSSTLRPPAPPLRRQQSESVVSRAKLGPKAELLDIAQGHDRQDEESDANWRERVKARLALSSSEVPFRHQLPLKRYSTHVRLPATVLLPLKRQDSTLNRQLSRVRGLQGGVQHAARRVIKPPTKSSRAD